MSFTMTVGRIIHVRYVVSDVPAYFRCQAAIVTDLPDDTSEHTSFPVTIFAATGPSAEAARRTTLQVGAYGDAWHDPRECPDLQAVIINP